MKQDYLDVLHALQKHHSLFAEFWAVGKLYETSAIPTAAIAWDKEGKGLQFLINPDFWNSLTFETKAFVIGHECLHAYFEHGYRSHGLDRRLANVAQDIVINHTLCETFGFDRQKLETVEGEHLADGWCWLDTCFPDRDDVESDRCFEYYYDLLEEQQKEQQQNGQGQGQGEGEDGDGDGNGSGMPQTVDSHDYFDGVDPEIEEAMREVIDNMSKRMHPDEMEDFQNKIEDSNSEESDKSKQAGNMAGNIRKQIILGRVVKKKKWETVVQDVLGSFLGREEEIEMEVWHRQPSWMSVTDCDFLLPDDRDQTIRIRDRINVWFYQDVSGSCIDYAERFLKAAASIPEDRFRIRGFCFDTRVHEVDVMKGEIKGGGGTYFHVLEEDIQRIVSDEGCKYPDVVFCITDGYGTDIHPQFPDRWHWFLTDENNMWGDQKQHLPENSHIHELKDFE